MHQGKPCRCHIFPVLNTLNCKQIHVDDDDDAGVGDDGDGDGDDDDDAVVGDYCDMNSLFSSRYAYSTTSRIPSKLDEVHLV